MKWLAHVGYKAKRQAAWSLKQDTRGTCNIKQLDLRGAKTKIITRNHKALKNTIKKCLSHGALKQEKYALPRGTGK